MELIKQLHFSGLVGLAKALLLPHFYDIRKFIRICALSECTLYSYYYRFNKSFLYIVHTLQKLKIYKDLVLLCTKLLHSSIFLSGSIRKKDTHYFMKATDVNGKMKKVVGAILHLFLLPKLRFSKILAHKSL